MNERGITLIEILVVIFIIAILLTILLLDFPKIQRQFALSRATYKFAQDVRKAQDLALSGEQKESNVQGYGVFINLNDSNKIYKIYADLKDGVENQYDENDKIINEIDLNKDAPGVIIKPIKNIENNSFVSINFNPPNPLLTITPNLEDGVSRLEVIFGLESDPAGSSNTRAVYIWKSGLIEARNNETFRF